MDQIEKLTTESGAKAHQRADGEDRAVIYREWHRTLSKKFAATDIDLIEWRYRGGVLIPVAVMEITRVDPEVKVTVNYLAAILKRMNERDTQGAAARYVAEKLGCRVWIVAFRYDLSEFWVYNLTDSQGWFHRTLAGMIAFLGKL